MKHTIEEVPFDEDMRKFVSDIYNKRQKLFEEYLSQLLWWNKRMNLMSRGVSRETVRDHIKHSLLITALKEFQQNEIIIDTGTGGGLPGIPLSISCPEKEVMLNDVVSKKIVAVKQMAHKLKLKKVSFSPKSIEKVKVSEGALIVTKHAFKVNGLLNMIGAEPWKSIVMLKGYQKVKEELSGVDTALSIGVYHLDKVYKTDFYSGKGLIVIKKKAEIE
ncbi:MAG: hypothetical protein FH748_05195 [Balneolaceae bacterium]|nr:hypothetical protein [Balneolaceae bacterium]